VNGTSTGKMHDNLKRRRRSLGQEQVRNDSLSAVGGVEGDLFFFPILGLLDGFDPRIEWRLAEAKLEPTILLLGCLRARRMISAFVSDWSMVRRSTFPATKPISPLLWTRRSSEASTT